MWYTFRKSWGEHCWLLFLLHYIAWLHKKKTRFCLRFGVRTPRFLGCWFIWLVNLSLTRFRRVKSYREPCLHVCPSHSRQSECDSGCTIPSDLSCKYGSFIWQFFRSICLQCGFVHDPLNRQLPPFVSPISRPQGLGSGCPVLRLGFLGMLFLFSFSNWNIKQVLCFWLHQLGPLGSGFHYFYGGLSDILFVFMFVEICCLGTECTCSIRDWRLSIFMPDGCPPVPLSHRYLSCSQIIHTDNLPVTRAFFLHLVISYALTVLSVPLFP